MDRERQLNASLLANLLLLSFVVLPMLWYIVEYFVAPLGSVVLVLAVVWGIGLCVRTFRGAWRDASPAFRRRLRVSWSINAVCIAVIVVSVALRIPPCTRHEPSGHSSAYACRNNLRQIDSAKAQWAQTAVATNGQPVLSTDVNRYVRGNTTPECPDGGTYTYGRIGEPPICSVSDFRGRPSRRYMFGLLFWRPVPGHPEGHVLPR